MTFSVAKQGETVVIGIEGHLVVGNRQALKQLMLDELARGERQFRVDFRSHEEWTAWRAQHDGWFAGWRGAILQDIRRFGVIEPISQVRHPPRSIKINPANLRESVSAAEMNSRKRGSLLAFDLAYRASRPLDNTR